MTKRTSMQPVKGTAKKRTLNSPTTHGSRGAPFSEQDPKRRLGNFQTTGEHARQGGRQSGLVGQSRRKFHTDKKKAK